MINISCYFSFFRFIHFSMIMGHGYCSWIIFEICSSVWDFEKLFSCYFVVHISLTRKFRINTHTPHCFSLKNHGQSFFLNHLSLQINYRINRGFYFCEQSLSEEIYRILLFKNEFCKKYMSS